MIAAGIDIGGTKIEVQVFDRDWSEVVRRRVATPQDYNDLVTTIAEQAQWASSLTSDPMDIGIGAAGLINAETGLALTANLPATGHPFPKDIEKATGRPITFVNDCRALALSEAVFGAGKGHRTVMSLILGTGVGGGLAVGGALLEGPTQTGGEFGHIPAAAHVLAAHSLPIWGCGCGRKGCIETYISGSGLTRLAKHVTGKDVTPPQIADRRNTDMAQVWFIWCDLIGEMIHSLTLVVDPDIIVVGGGLSNIDGIVDDISRAAKATQIGNFSIPKITLAAGGDASGARGAAYAAWQENADG